MISVLIPIHGSGPHLRVALDSVEAQRETDIEILIVDDDCAYAVLEELERRARRDSRYRLIESPRRGLIHALNAGLDAAQGTLLARFDADDWMHPDRLRLQRAYLDAHPEIALVATQFHLLDAQPGGGYERYRDWQNALVTPQQIELARFIESPIAHPTICMRTRALRKLDGYRDCNWPEDYDLWLRLIDAGAGLAKLPEDLHGWRDHPSRTSRLHPRYQPEAFRRLKAHFLKIGPLRTHARAWIWGAGPIGTRLYRALGDEGARIAGFIDIDPKKIGSTRGGLRIHSPEILAKEPDAFLLAAVGGAGSAVLRARLLEWGLVEGRNFLSVA